MGMLWDRTEPVAPVNIPPQSGTGSELHTQQPAAPPALAQSAEEAIAKFGCAACHAVLQSQSPVGPSLKDVGSRLSLEQIRTSIVDPKAEISPGFPPIMPEFPNMALAELNLMVQFLAQQDGK